MNYDYIIVQAGGKGSRLGYLTENKPKCLVPIGNLPMIFHLFEKFPDKRFIIIGDYKFEVLQKYLRIFCKVKYELICASGFSGTNAGIGNALCLIPPNTPFVIIWSDLILADDFKLPNQIENFVGLSGDFQCRWKFYNGEFTENKSFEYGVAGLFGFEKKSEAFNDIPDNGEFVRWLSEKSFNFNSVKLHGTKEYGVLDAYRNLKPRKWRPFNNIIYSENTIEKYGITEQGRALAVREKNWYKIVEKNSFTNIPKIFSYEPFVMERIKGRNLYELNEYSEIDKKTVLFKTVEVLNNLHQLSYTKSSQNSVNTAYYFKTIERIKKVKNLIPFSDRDSIIINGKRCINVYKNVDILKDLCSSLVPSEFCLIHGDCTFSNIMISDNQIIVLIDPRGYFGDTEIFGDELYDWAKLYYSIIGNYDQFNLKRFKLSISKTEVNISIDSNGWEKLEQFFFSILPGHISIKKLKLIHAIIWLSLTTYAWEDYDSICGAYYNGLYYLQEAVDLYMEDNDE